MLASSLAGTWRGTPPCPKLVGFNIPTSSHKRLVNDKQAAPQPPMAPKSRLSESSLPKPPTNLSETILISEGAQITGTHPVSIGDNTVVSPRCKINSTLGPVTIGNNCILNERTQLTAPDENGLVVEDYVVVEMNAVVEARRLGEGTAVEVGVRVGKAAEVGKVSDVCFVSTGRDKMAMLTLRAEL